MARDIIAIRQNNDKRDPSWEIPFAPITSTPRRIGITSIDASFEIRSWQSPELTSRLSSHPLLTMDTQAYPGKGLSLPQLVFALNAELTSMSCSPS